MSKREKRLAAKQMKLDREIEKQARLLDRVASDIEEGKRARMAAAPAEERSIRNVKNPDSILQEKVTWCITKADREGEWTWKVAREWGDEAWKSEIQPHVEAFQNLTWREVSEQRTGGKGKRRQKHHEMEVDVIVEEAQARWKAQGLEQFTEAFRFRLGGQKRLWGYRLKAHFHIVWWDPTHQIYPVELKNT